MTAPFKQRGDAVIHHLPYKAFMAELGVFTGQMSEYILSNRKDVMMVLVDKWPIKNETSESYKASGDFHAELSSEKQNEYYKSTITKLKKYNHRAKIMREWTHDAAKTFDKPVFDLVFIDADHSYEGCKQDIEDWWPLVKTGGWLSGHDYANDEYNFGVTQAVDEFVLEHGLTLELGDNFTWFVRKT